ncbi:MAG: energy transducer TonB [Aridibacter sp.]
MSLIVFGSLLNAKTYAQTVENKKIESAKNEKELPKVSYLETLDCVGTEEEKNQLARKYKNIVDSGILDNLILDSKDNSTSNLIPKKVIKIDEKNKRIFILSKPQPIYTCKAKLNNMQGIVFLSIEFLKNGKIGKIKKVEGLPDGLTEQAIEAAKKIKFEPEMKNGKPVTVVKQIKYNYTIY